MSAADPAVGVSPALDAWRELVDLDRLAAWMDARGLESGPIEEAARPPGGTQNILLKFRRGERWFMLRRPPLAPRMNGSETMRREARVLGALATSDVPHPRLIAGCPEEDVLGAAFYLMEPIEGFTPRDEMPELHAGDPAIRHRMGLEMVDAIAALAGVDYVAKGLSTFGKPEGFLERQVPRWRAQLESYAEHPGWPGLAGLPGVDRIGRWLDDNRPADFRPGLIHGDFHFANVLFSRDSADLVAMVDWELVTIGEPMVDLGGLLSHWPEDGADIGPVKPWSGFPTRAELIARYAECTGRDASTANWYEVLACYKIGCILEGTYARACAGRAPKETGDYLHAATLGLFEKAMRKIGVG